MSLATYIGYILPVTRHGINFFINIDNKIKVIYSDEEDADDYLYSCLRSINTYSLELYVEISERDTVFIISCIDNYCHVYPMHTKKVKIN